MLKELKWSKRDNRVTRKQLRERLDRYTRDPFKDVLTQLLQVRPTPEAMFQWALEHPDKWASAVSVMAKLAGYADQQEINLNITDTTQMSDAQLLQRLVELRQRLSNANADQLQLETKKEALVSQGPVSDAT